MGYGAHIPLSIRWAVDDWDAKVVAHYRKTQPLRQRPSYYWCVKNVLAQLLWEK